MRKILIGLIAVVLLLLVTSLALVSFAPKTLLSWLDAQTTTIDVSVDEISVAWLPLQIQATALQFSNSALNAQVQQFEVQVSLWSYLWGEPFWRGQLAHVVVNTAETQETNTDADQAANATIPNLGLLFSLQALALENVRLNGLGLPPGNSISIQAEQQPEEIEFILKYQDDTQLLEAGGELAALSLEPASQRLEISTMGVWRQAPRSISFDLRSEMNNRQGKALQLSLLPSVISFARTDVLSRHFSIEVMTIDYSPAGGSLDLDLQGQYLVDGLSESLPVQIDAEARGLTTAPNLQVQGDIAGMQLALAAQAEASSYQASLKVEASSWPREVIDLPYSDAELFPLVASADLQGTRQELQIQKFSLQSPANAATGQLTASLNAPVQSITGSLQIARGLLPMLPEHAVDTPADPQAAVSADSTTDEAPSPATPSTVNEAATGSAATMATSADQPPLFSAEPLDWSWLQRWQIDFQVAAQTINARDLQLEDLQLGLILDDTGLNVTPLSVSLGGGRLEGSAALLPAADDGVTAQLNVTGNDILLQALNLMPAEELRGGTVQTKAKLSANGRSPLQLVQTLTGGVSLRMEDLVLQNDLVDLAGSDVLLEALNRLNPFRKDDPATVVQCAVLNFDVQEGVINNRDKLVVETQKMRVEGKAKVTLPTEQLDVTFKPRAKSGFGVGIGNLVKFVKLGGDLRNPGMEVDALGLLQSGAAVGAAVSTGGISLLAEGLVSRAIGDSGCAQIPNELPEPESQTPAQPGVDDEATAPAIETPSENPIEPPSEPQETPPIG